MNGDIIQAPQSCKARFCFSTKSRLSVRVSHDCGKHEKQQVGGFLIGAIMKVCTRCHEEKPESEFHKAKREPDGLKYWCKECALSYSSEYRKKNYVPVLRKRKVKKTSHFFWTHEIRHQERAKCKPVEGGSDYALRRRYGITLQEYREILEKQNGVCAVCGNGPGKRRLHVDHCHKTGKIRALLCTNCNSALGAARDDINRLYKLIQYLEKHEITLPSPA
jgi:hypothetical protein